ncbi:MAG TPA: flagellar basal body rod protein FlgB [Gammaproteobacteria bacterium]|nr:flagellar basal body rod protein FlgB [Gammaproteobacteria bacterium]
MAISFDQALGNLPQHLALYSRRSSLLAANLANADTPNFKARDIDFRSVLARAEGSQMSLRTTQPGHLGGAGTAALKPQILYRIPNQPSMDGNTVDGQVEKAQFTENAVRYQSTMTFLSGRIKGLLLAIKGE